MRQLAIRVHGSWEAVMGLQAEGQADKVRVTQRQFSASSAPSQCLVF